jgi:hypothetical protein
MFSLSTLSKINSLAEIHKNRVRAKGLNTPGGHAKDLEKGRVDKKRNRRTSLVVL